MDVIIFNWTMNMWDLAVYASSIVIGFSLGMIGAGGSILTIPVFVYILEEDPVASSVYSMFVVGACSMVGSIQAVFNKLVDFKITLVFGIPSVIGVLIARKIVFPSIPDKLFSIGSFGLSKEILLMLFLSALMFSAGMKMVRASSDSVQDHDGAQKIKWSLLLFQGLLVGMITGMLGIGGGFLIVPTLYFCAKLPMKMAIGTTLLIITINSLIGFLSSYSSVLIDWDLLTRFSLGAILGILIGTKLSATIASKYLKRIFGWFVIGISSYIVSKQFFV